LSLRERMEQEKEENSTRTKLVIFKLHKTLNYLFMYSLFDESGASSGYTASNYRMTVDS
jgi:hypothetical protein